jgi:hypothetical protein
LDSRPLWVLFTSSLDESIDESRSVGAFPTQAAWIDASIAYARAHDDVQLVIRVHPNTGSDKSLGRNPQDEAYFARLAQTLPPNVRLVPGDDATSSYTLALMADLGLVWYSTIGVEMVALGRPVIRAGASWLAYCDFFVAAGDPSGYAAALDTARQNPSRATARDVAGAWRFAHAWYFRQTIPFPLVKQPAWFVGETDYTGLEALAPGKDAGLDRICAVFMDGAPLHMPPAARAAELADAETAAIHARIASYVVPS